MGHGLLTPAQAIIDKSDRFCQKHALEKDSPARKYYLFMCQVYGMHTYIHIYVCVCVYLPCILWCFDIKKKKKKKNSGWEECPSWASQFLERARDLTWSKPLICRVTNPDPSLLQLAYTPQQAVSFCLNCPRARSQGTRNQRLSIQPQSQSTLFKLPNPKLFPLSCFVFPSEDIGFSSLLLLLCDPNLVSPVDLCGEPCLLFLWETEIILNLSFSGVGLSVRSLSHVYKLRPEYKTPEGLTSAYLQGDFTWGYLPFFFLRNATQ